MPIPPESDHVITSALAHSWEAGLLALVVVALCGLTIGLVWLTNRAAERREERLALRISQLEAYVEATLIDALKDCTAALVASNDAIRNFTVVLDKLSKSLDDRPCMWNADRQRDLIVALKDRLTDK